MTTSVLLADGDEALEDIFRLFLSRCGFEVYTARNGLECLQRLRQHRCQAAILSREILWGGGDGVVAAMRQEHELAEVAVILTTTVTPAPALYELVRPPVVQALLKPFSLAQLLEAVRGATSGPPRKADAQLTPHTLHAELQSGMPALPACG